MASSLRTAASLVLITPSSHVLFMLRPASGSFPSTHVFPGGVVEPSDPSLSYTAFRETYEETGLLLGPRDITKPVVHAVGEYPSYDSAFKHVFGLETPPKSDASEPDKSTGTWKSWWTPENEKSKLDLDRFSNWTTPEHLPKRFATQFYLYRVPQAFQFPELPPLSSAPVSIEERAKEPGNGVLGTAREVEKLEWLTPWEALTQFQKGKIKLMPPQYYLMNLLFEEGIDKAIEKVHDRVITPKIVEKLPDGKVKMDWGRGEFGLIKFGKKNVVDEIEILRTKL
ncbi:uncharacterized protein SAPINGB_P002040 [Magnusiomyces paraingens]|uniref:Nudix hydrolase domain-containing protein n=1 Tax=Magnusiomyces paraingens TaxID=2606893 RepID=A0A5E8BJV5_9ASCO|nr:uncharacterized protein SAPINGB_P002040 [Saprochaete ingens]VVT48970.1 unnamed protein product [Saprochaete ingens]